MRIALVVAVAAMALLSWDLRRQVESVSTRLNITLQVVESLFRKEVDVTVLKTSWVDTQGLTQVVETPRSPGETDDQHSARHDAAVAVRLAAHPKQGD